MSDSATARVAADVRLERVEKSFDGKTRVVDRIDLTVAPGEFFALLGPSGGQQQRVALAGAIVIRPRVLLCDEPLAALDRKLRQSMQVELKLLQQQLGVTLIFVTHDQEEAMTVSDRIAVMNAGRIDQIGSPSEIYNRPRTRFVSDFIGEINLFEGEWRDDAFVSNGIVL